jgi:hypothetical protein
MVIAGRELDAARREFEEREERLRARNGEPPPGSPQWWRKRLLRRMDRRQYTLDVWSAYYAGDHPLLFQTTPFKKAFGPLFSGLNDNWCELVVDSLEERCNVDGFRFADELKTDNDAWRVWQANELDAESGVAHTEAEISSECHVLVWYGTDGEPEITIEDASSMIVETEPASRYRRRAALKRWRDDDGHARATLYLPDAIYKWRTRGPIEYAGGEWLGLDWLEWQDTDDDTWPIENPLDRVPVVPLWNKPRAGHRSSSELEPVIPLQNACNKLLADLLVSSEFAGFRQRYATGLDIPIDPETKKPVEPFAAAVDRLWIANAKLRDDDGRLIEPKFGEFEATDLRPYVDAIELAVQHIASKSRTPPHYFYLGGGQPPSGESIKSAETGLVTKARRRMRHWGQSWEEVIALAFLVLGDRGRANAPKETVWADPESRSEAEHTDALVKKQALGVPNEALWEEAGYSPVEIERFRRMRAEAAVVTAGLGELAAPLAPPPVPNGQPPAAVET